MSSFSAPRHREMKYPALGMIGAIRHAGYGLESVKRALTQCQETGRKLRAHVLRFLGVAVAYGQIHVPDGKGSSSRFLDGSECDFANARAGSICAYDYASRDPCSVGECSSHAGPVWSKFNVAEVLAVLDVDAFTTQFSHLASGYPQAPLVGYACKHISRLAVDDGIVAPSINWHSGIARRLLHVCINGGWQESFEALQGPVNSHCPFITPDVERVFLFKDGVADTILFQGLSENETSDTCSNDEDMHLVGGGSLRGHGNGNNF